MLSNNRRWPELINDGEDIQSLGEGMNPRHLVFILLERLSPRLIMSFTNIVGISDREWGRHHENFDLGFVYDGDECVGI